MGTRLTVYRSLIFESDVTPRRAAVIPASTSVSSALCVIPAQAARYFKYGAVFERIFWIPACAGMTEGGGTGLH